MMVTEFEIGSGKIFLAVLRCSKERDSCEIQAKYDQNNNVIKQQK